MLSRFTACFLVALVLAPFTAPFRTCDLTVLVDSHHTRQAPAKPLRSTTLASEVNLASTPALSNISRYRLLQLSHLSKRAVECFSAAAILAFVAAPPIGIQNSAAHSAILRV